MRDVLHMKIAVVLLAWLHGLASFAIGAETTSVTRVQESAPVAARPAHPYFRITVVDEETSRGIPCARLLTTNATEYWTDSAGVAAFYEPDLMNQKVYFEAASHGYTHAKDGWFGFSGRILDTVPGGSEVMQMHRDNIAQRLYRMTGAGIYRDSILLGDKAPPVEEDGKPPVAGQDGGDAAFFKGKLFWFWGDTVIPRFPLGVFKSTCAVSDLPANGGLDPEAGIAYKYMRKGEYGEPRPIIDLPGRIYWYCFPRVVRDKAGRERLVSDYAQIEQPMRTVERGLIEFNEGKGVFELVRKYPDDCMAPFDSAQGSPFRHKTNGVEYFYYPAPYPSIRCPADYESQTNFGVREAFSCLKDGSRFNGSAEQLDRDQNGNLRWHWKRNTSPIAENEMEKLVKSGAMKPEEQWYAIRDADSGKLVRSHSGSIYWNPYRKRWVCIRLENGGETFIGEVWHLEGDTPLGPWVYARKIVTHAWKDHHVSFYCTAQIPDFDKNEGRTIFFKGSFSAEFGNDKVPVPRQNYNTFMYKLALDDPRLFLPVPVYRIGDKARTYATKQDLPDNVFEPEIAWFAPDRPGKDTVPIHQAVDTEKQTVRLIAGKTDGRGDKPVFYAVPFRDDFNASSPLAQTVPLFEFTQESTGRRIYSTKDTMNEKGFIRSPAPVCRVWPNPIERFNPYKVR